MMDLARLGADDKTFITAIQEKTASALKIRDPIDRYLALQDIIEKNV